MGMRGPIVDVSPPDRVSANKYRTDRLFLSPQPYRASGDRILGSADHPALRGGGDSVAAGPTMVSIQRGDGS